MVQISLAFGFSASGALGGDLITSSLQPDLTFWRSWFESTGSWRSWLSARSEGPAVTISAGSFVATSPERSGVSGGNFHGDNLRQQPLRHWYYLADTETTTTWDNNLLPSSKDTVKISANNRKEFWKESWNECRKKCWIGTASKNNSS